MPSRAKGNKLYANFSRGLITEASPLAFPENATIDELNCDIQENGVRVRRYGFDVEAADGQTQSNYNLGDAIQTHVWKAAGNESAYTILVVQIGNNITFYNLSATKPIYTHRFTSVGAEIDLEDYNLTAYEGEMKNKRCSFASGRGALFIAHPYMDSLIVEFEPSTTVFTTTQKVLKIRDFKGVDDGLAVDQEPATLSATHHYNLRNQGWINPEATNSGTSIGSFTLYGGYEYYNYPTTTGPIAEYFTAKSRYPSNNKIWWSAKNADGDFDPDQLTKLFFGNTRAPRGHFIVNAFDKDYTDVSGVSGLTAETLNERASSVAFSSGRVFWSAYNTVYFSTILDNPQRALDCFQEADPTSEDISDLIATDGGVIEIPNAISILAIRDVGNGIAVFATNGVWFIAAGSQGFTALEYSLTKISDIGCISSASVVAADNSIYWWSQNGIQALVVGQGGFGPIAGQFDKASISQDTINRFFNDLTDYQKSTAKGFYDPASNKVHWLYENDGTGQVKSQYHYILTFDATLQAFVPWTIGATGSPQRPYVAGAFVEEKVLAGTEDPSFMNYLVMFQNAQGGDVVTFGNFTDDNYVDFANLEFIESSFKQTYESFILTGYEVLQDGVRVKQAPHVGVFFKRTESTVLADTTNNPNLTTLATPTTPSSSSGGTWTYDPENPLDISCTNMDDTDEGSGKPRPLYKNLPFIYGEDYEISFTAAYTTGSGATFRIWKDGRVAAHTITEGSNSVTLEVGQSYAGTFADNAMGFVLDGTTTLAITDLIVKRVLPDEFEITTPSSCTFQTRWNWSNADNGKWSTAVQAYRPRTRPFVADSGGSADPEADVVYSVNKVRGSGRAVQFKFSESQEGYGFELLGWHVFYNAKTNP